MNLDDRIKLFLNERTKTTRTAMVKAERGLKIEKSKDTGPELYVDITKFLAIYLNSLDTKNLNVYKIINREKAEQMVTDMVAAHPMPRLCWIS